MEVGGGVTKGVLGVRRNPTREEGSDLFPMFRNQARQLCVHQGCLEGARWLLKLPALHWGEWLPEARWYQQAGLTCFSTMTTPHSPS